MDANELIQKLGELEARELRDENGREIKGEHWVRRDEVVELLLKSKCPCDS